MLSPSQLAARDGKLTASRVACLMTGDQTKILNLWREMVGDQEYVEEDLSDVWAVQLGSWTEALNLDWYERRTGRGLSRRGDVVTSPHIEWAAATLDAWDNTESCPVEAKHVGGFETIEKVLDRYAPQSHWQMICTNSHKCIFTIIEGAREPRIETVEYDAAYADTLMERANQFMAFVRTLTPPIALEPVAAPVRPVKTYDFTGNNKWAAEAATWATTRQAAKDHAAADRAIKAVVPADAIKCHGHGITVSRNKAGSLSIREQE